MQSWVIVYLGGSVGTDTLVVGVYPTLQSAMAAIASTGAPFNYQPCDVWGPPIVQVNGVPQVQYTEQDVAIGAWIAIAAGSSENGGVKLFGYGPFTTKALAETWARGQDSPGAFSFGEIYGQP